MGESNPRRRMESPTSSPLDQRDVEVSAGVEPALRGLQPRAFASCRRDPSAPPARFRQRFRRSIPIWCVARRSPTDGYAPSSRLPARAPRRHRRCRYLAGGALAPAAGVEPALSRLTAGRLSTWLRWKKFRREESNLDRRLQRPRSCRWTTPERGGGRAAVPRAGIRTRRPAP